MVRVALVGCGTMGRVHTNGYQLLENARLQAVCDLDEEKADALAKASGAKRYLSFDEMLQNEAFEVLDLCLPTYMHKEFAVRAMRAGKHVFCEKPIALNEQDAKEMVQVAREMGVKFSVGHVLRFFPPYRQAIQTISSGKIGVPKLIRTIRNQAFPQWSWNGWYKDYSKSGGPILDLVIHDFDWILHNFGEVERVYAKSFNGTVTDQEHCMVTLRLKNGAIAHVEGSWGYPRGAAFHTSFEIVGTAGQLEYDNMEQCGLKKLTCEESFSTGYLAPSTPNREPYAAELREFIDCIEQNTPVTVTGEQAIEALRISLAAIESSQTGKPVTLKKGGEAQ